MRYALMFCLMVFSVMGCAVVSTSIVPTAMPWRPADRLTLGMTRAQVLALMDAKVVVGYEIDPVTGVSKPVEAQALYSSERVDIGGLVYQVDRYIVHPPAAERVAESELFPVVYKDGLLVAKGYDGLMGLKAKK